MKNCKLIIRNINASITIRRRMAETIVNDITLVSINTEGYKIYIQTPRIEKIKPISRISYLFSEIYKKIIENNTKIKIKNKYLRSFNRHCMNSNFAITIK
jgi:hypothetical protein